MNIISPFCLFCNIRNSYFLHELQLYSYITNDLPFPFILQRKKNFSVNIIGSFSALGDSKKNYTKLVLFKIILLTAPRLTAKRIPPARQRITFINVEPSGVTTDTIINNMMIPEQQWEFIRNSMRSQGHKITIHYDVALAI